MLLTSRMVRAARRPRERRYVLADEHGLSRHVMPRGSKWWRFRYRFQHAEKMISLGVYPNVNLATARLLHADARGSSYETLIPVLIAKRSVRRRRVHSKSLHASGSSSCSRASRNVNFAA